MTNLKTDLFTLAEMQLQKEKQPYTLTDVIDYAIKIRKWLDKNPKKIFKFLQEDKRIKNKKARYYHYLKFHK